MPMNFTVGQFCQSMPSASAHCVPKRVTEAPVSSRAGVQKALPALVVRPTYRWGRNRSVESGNAGLGLSGTRLKG